MSKIGRDILGGRISSYESRDTVQWLKSFAMTARQNVALALQGIKSKSRLSISMALNRLQENLIEMQKQVEQLKGVERIRYETPLDSCRKYFDLAKESLKLDQLATLKANLENIDTRLYRIQIAKRVKRRT